MFRRRTFAIAAGLLGAVLALWHWRPRSDVEYLRQAIQKLRYRPSEARLSGEYPYRPAAPRLLGDASQSEARLDTTFLEAANRLANDPIEGDSIDRLEAVAGMWLYMGAPYNALPKLREAIERADSVNAPSQRKAALWNDLAVAYVQSVTSDDRRGLVNALDAAERAHRADASNPAVEWNRALVLEMLSQKDAASRAWREYLRRDAAVAWAPEARKHLAGLEGRRVATPSAKEIRTHAEEELLPKWAWEFVHGSDSTGTLKDVRAAAARLRAATGESLLSDVTDEIHGSNALVRQRAKAFLEYKAARDEYRAGRYTTARQQLETAERSLRKTHSRLAILANIFRAGATYSENRFADALKVLDPALDPCVPAQHYYAACGVKSWIEGLALVQTGDPSASVTSYERALAAFSKAQEFENVATVLSLRAETLDFMSANDEAWADRMNALEMFHNRPMGDRPLIWMVIALAALRDHCDYAASAMLSEIAADARRRNDALWVAEAMIWRAIAQQRIEGQVRDADIDAIRVAVARISDPAVAARSQANLGLVLAEIRGSEPAARGDLDQALEFYRISNDQFNRTTALAQRANVRATMKDYAAADADLMATLDEFQRQSNDIADPFTRTLFSDRSRALFIVASRMEAARRRPWAALWLSNRARQIALSQTAPPKVAADAEHLGRELVRSVPPNVTVIYQDLDEDQLRTWVIRAGEMRFASRSINQASLLADIARFRTELQSERPQDVVIPDARALYDVLLRPVGQLIADKSWIVYSPSAELRALPFGALHDGFGFLAEKRTVALARSLDAVTKASLRLEQQSAVLLVNAEAAGEPRLENADQETAFLTKHYGARATVLAGKAATPAAFLNAARHYDVIHITAHGRTDHRPLHNSMLFGPERLRAYDVMNLSLPRRPLVVLAGCSTDDETTGRATLSLANAFEVAGAAAVIGSLWDVDDYATMKFFTRFHRELAVDGLPADAFHRTQKRAIVEHNSYLWAAFQLQL